MCVQDSVTAFQTSFFSFLSLCFAIYSGNTMAFLYDVSSLPLTLAINEQLCMRNIHACADHPDNSLSH